MKQRREMVSKKSWNRYKGLCVGDRLSEEALQHESPLWVFVGAESH